MKAVGLLSINLWASWLQIASIHAECPIAVGIFQPDSCSLVVYVRSFCAIPLCASVVLAWGGWSWKQGLFETQQHLVHVWLPERLVWATGLYTEIKKVIKLFDIRREATNFIEHQSIFTVCIDTQISHRCYFYVIFIPDFCWKINTQLWLVNTHNSVHWLVTENKNKKKTAEVKDVNLLLFGNEYLLICE